MQNSREKAWKLLAWRTAPATLACAGALACYSMDQPAQPPQQNLLADPALYPVFAVGFIDGQEAPRIETEQSFGFDGVQMKVILDYGTAVLDFRGAITCAGQ